MSYGHADKIARGVVGAPTADGENAPAVDPALYRREDVRRILAAHDIGALYRILKDAGVLTGQSQPEVSEILAGRRVLAYNLLVRIAAGLGVPRELMGLGYGTCGGDGFYRGEATVAGAPEGVSAEMLRRHVLALGPIAAFGAPIK
ncbi:MAG: hypothetical protein ABR608_10145, partial [Pseudonocardiaceae bacterium]